MPETECKLVNKAEDLRVRQKKTGQIAWNEWMRVDCLSNTTPKDDTTQNDLDEEGKTMNTSSFKRRGSMTQTLRHFMREDQIDKLQVRNSEGYLGKSYPYV